MKSCKYIHGPLKRLGFQKVQLKCELMLNIRIAFKLPNMFIIPLQKSKTVFKQSMHFQNLLKMHNKYS